MSDTDHNELPEIDFDRVATLLGVVEKISNIGPQLMDISGMAMAELVEINQSIIDAKHQEAGQAYQAEPMLSDNEEIDEETGNVVTTGEQVRQEPIENNPAENQKALRPRSIPATEFEPTETTPVERRV